MTEYPILNEYLETAEKEGALSYEKNAPLSKYSSFKIGGECSFAVIPKTKEALCALLDFNKKNAVRTLVFGNASNVLFADEGIDGCVVFTAGLKNIEEKDGTVTADAGVTLTELSRFMQKRGYEGAEFLCGIPGNIGGGVFMNAGAYEHSVSEILVDSTYYDRTDGKIKTIANSEHDFSYRHSVYEDNGGVILQASFKCRKAENPEKVKALMDDHLKTRSEKQPLEYPSAGSVFKRYPGYFTSKLIDEAGLKGYTVGGAQISEKHAGFIVNRGNARAKDVMELVKIVQERIFALHGIHIECEIRMIK
ncbi:MAG: UDP-N-acetylmuramate dehydrogenase [Clostridia bacterium]|nr:UDP-N-acetylmuramate dehydrogenase [Clostridia bacterium]